jgi:hypothetical protein
MTVPTLALPVVDATAGITLPVTPPVVPPVVEGRFTAADIEAARKQEKDKLYQTVESWESKFMEQGQVLAELMKAKDVDVKAAKAEATKAAEEAAAKEWAEKDSKTLVADVRAEFEAKLAAMAKQNDVERETFAKERSFTELRDYAQAAVAKAVAANEVAPELVGYVTGNNTAEIDASLIRVKATTETLLSSFAEATAAAAIPPVPRGVSPTGYTPAGPMDADPSHKTYSPQDIKDMSMEEYASKRGAFLGAAAQSGRDRGMFA